MFFAANRTLHVPLAAKPPPLHSSVMVYLRFPYLTSRPGRLPPTFPQQSPSASQALHLLLRGPHNREMMCNLAAKAPTTNCYHPPLAAFVECGSNKTSNHYLLSQPFFLFGVWQLNSFATTVITIFIIRSRVYYPGDTLFNEIPPPQKNPASSPRYAVYHTPRV